jgi:hypothetical protein
VSPVTTKKRGLIEIYAEARLTCGRSAEKLIYEGPEDNKNCLNQRMCPAAERRLGRGVIFAVAIAFYVLCMEPGASAQSLIEVPRKAYKEQYLAGLNINGTSPLVGVQYGDPRAPIRAPRLTVSGVSNRHRYICALIQHISGAYNAALAIRNPRKGSTLTLVLPTEVVSKLSPRAAELSVLARASLRTSDCSKDAELLAAGWGAQPYELRESLYALLNLSPTASATASIHAAALTEPQFCERLELRMGDLRINAQRFGIICALETPDCASPATLQIIVRAESHREAFVREKILRECR